MLTVRRTLPNDTTLKIKCFVFQYPVLTLYFRIISIQLNSFHRRVSIFAASLEKESRALLKNVIFEKKDFITCIAILQTYEPQFGLS